MGRNLPDDWAFLLAYPHDAAPPAVYRDLLAGEDHLLQQPEKGIADELGCAELIGGFSCLVQVAAPAKQDAVVDVPEVVVAAIVVEAAF